MRFLKLLWFTSLFAFIGYFIYDYFESGFKGELIAVGLALVFSGVGLFNKK